MSLAILHSSRGAIVRGVYLCAAVVAGALLIPPGTAGAAGGTLAPDRVARLLAGMETSVPGGVPVPEAKLAEYAGKATAHWHEYERRIGGPMQKWAQSELVAAPGATIFYPFSGPDFATVQRMYPDAARYVLVAMQRAEAPPALERATAADLAAFMGRFGEAWKQFAQIGFFRTLDLDEEAKQPGLRAGTLAPILAFAVRSGYAVVAVDPVRVNEAGTDLEVHPGDRAERSTWNSARVTLQAGARRVVVDYVRMNLSDAALAERPAERAWIERMAANRTVLKAASHLLQGARFTVVRDAILERAPSVLQDETGLDYAALAKAFDVKLYGRFTKPHQLFNPDAQKALAQAYKERTDVKPLSFRVSYQRQPEANLQVANRAKPAGSSSPPPPPAR